MKKADISEALREHLRKLGSLGGNAARDRLSVEQRRANASKAATARWGKRKKKTAK